MYDLKKLEKKFHEFLKPSPDEDYHDLSEVRITEDLLTQEEAVYIPFGWISYFLFIEDGRPVICAHAISRMDLDSICFIDEDGWVCHDVFCGENMDVFDKYRSLSRGVRPHRDLKGLPKARR